MEKYLVCELFLPYLKLQFRNELKMKVLTVSALVMNTCDLAGG